MAEYLMRKGMPEDTSTIAHAMMISFKAAVNSAAAGGYKAGTMINTNGWEIMFAAGRAGDKLPVIKHALYK